jgi:hypothetical protein
VCSLPTDAAGLLGTDFMEGTGAVINFEGSKMSLTDIAATSRACVESSNRQAVLTVFTRSKEGRSPQPSQKEMPKVDEKSSVSSPCVLTTSQSRVWLVKTRENIIIAPRCRQVLTGKVETEKGQSLPPLVCIEPAQIPIEGVVAVRALARVEQNAGQTIELTSRSSAEVTRSRNNTYVMVANFSNQDLTLHKATVLGVAERVSEPLRQNKCQKRN